MSTGSQAWAERHAGGAWGGERGDSQLEYIGVLKIWEVVQTDQQFLYRYCMILYVYVYVCLTIDDIKWLL